MTESGLRFDERVPVEVIELSAPQLQGPEADQYEIIDHKVTRKLAQRPGSYVVLEYRRPVLKHKPSATLMEVPAPSAVFDNSLADVSFLAGLLVAAWVTLILVRQRYLAGDAHAVAELDAIRVLQANAGLDQGVVAKAAQSQAQPGAAQQQGRCAQQSQQGLDGHVIQSPVGRRARRAAVCRVSRQQFLVG